MFLFSLFYFKFDIFPLAHSKIHNDNSQTFNLSLDRELGLFVVVCVCSHSLSLCVSSLSLSLFLSRKQEPFFRRYPSRRFFHMFSRFFTSHSRFSCCSCCCSLVVVVADVMSPSWFFADLVSSIFLFFSPAFAYWNNILLYNNIYWLCQL